jgi:Rps23 Pro-64 3,4-dihydroxylase Tpa1-like proline 4-hydroxylase
MAPGWLTHIKFLMFCRQAPFRGFIQRIIGVDPIGVNTNHTRITGPGQFVRKHTDAVPGRRMTMVLYPGREWRPSEGGLFRQYRRDGECRSLDPLPNRVVLFRVSPTIAHDVEPVSAGAPPRWGYTIWLGEPKAALKPPLATAWSSLT